MRPCRFRGAIRGVDGLAYPRPTLLDDRSLGFGANHQKALVDVYAILATCFVSLFHQITELPPVARED